jgi:hypothetical protein
MAAGSLLLLLAHAIFSLDPVQRFRSWNRAYTPVSQTGSAPVSLAESTLTSRIQTHIRSHGGSAVFAFKVLRLASTSALCALIFATILSGRTEPEELWPQLALGLTALYALILAFAYVLLPAPASRAAAPYATVAVLSLFAVYAYRDVWPLLTFTLRPLDRAEGLIVWAKVTLSALAGVLLPLLEPYVYVPVNPAVRTTPSLAFSQLCGC